MIAMTHAGYVAAGWIGTFALIGGYAAHRPAPGPHPVAPGPARGAPVELTPRALDDDDVTVEEGEVAARRRARRRRSRRRWAPLAVLAVVVLGLGALVYKGLNDATLYFRNADEAVAQRDELGSKRFRLQGTVMGEPVVDGDDVRFEVAYNGVAVDVEHVGTPPDMFRPGIPVVLEGHWAEGSDVFDERPDADQARRDLRVTGRLRRAHRRGRAGRRRRPSRPSAGGRRSAG